ncbi:phosphotransferase family protein [Demequina aurantiaca]|uniref:phosphotransferase family protein n=1 Tax=Demequina aurantiaca TaxID=676200 RepID=UPI003D3517F3
MTTVAHPEGVGPRPFNTRRMGWSDLPEQAQAHIVDLVGSPVAEVRSTAEGFSPGFAGIVQCTDGSQTFVKATSAIRHPHSIALGRREIVVNAALPAAVHAPVMEFSHDDGDWALAGFEVIDGGTPHLPWTADGLEAALEAIADLSEVQVDAADGFRPFSESLAEAFRYWGEFAALPTAEQAARAAGREWGNWALAHADTLATWEAEAPAASAGNRLIHGDLRADNMVLDRAGDVWLVDWPHAEYGAPWVDLVGLLPSVEMQGGGPCAGHFREHALGSQVEHEELRALVTAIAGYFLLGSWTPAPEQIPTLRQFQFAQAGPALRWLQSLEPSLLISR